MRTLLAVCGLALVLGSAAVAHSWYPEPCCHAKADDPNGDCEPVPCEDLAENQDGTWRYGKAQFSKSDVHPSQDRYCHACVAKWNPNQGLCLFIQQGV